MSSFVSLSTLPLYFTSYILASALTKVSRGILSVSGEYSTPPSAILIPNFSNSVSFKSSVILLFSLIEFFKIVFSEFSNSLFSSEFLGEILVKMANSSPPSLARLAFGSFVLLFSVLSGRESLLPRDKKSDSRLNTSLNAWPTIPRSLSPASCPIVSLTILKLFKSPTITINLSSSFSFSKTSLRDSCQYNSVAKPDLESNFNFCSATSARNF